MENCSLRCPDASVQPTRKEGTIEKGFGGNQDRKGAALCCGNDDVVGPYFWVTKMTKKVS
jgi:hypothetical protein